ncbi:alpha/beta hydrolase [Deinococcus sp. SDU3-2]|uniref:Alpha/beta hydrolase n=1 Tax=Deinococcus terrestris TaxID=2651870 RepID=A0A7X1TQ64_9DEIO|nr:alpha/beta hydrolase [Deinococcus terrestris]MPY65320.1 alpha/beta hydrolase [Deinococcus terrestris]
MTPSPRSRSRPRHARRFLLVAGALVLLGTVASRSLRRARRETDAPPERAAIPLDPRMRRVGEWLRQAPIPSVAEMTAEQAIQASRIPHTGPLVRGLTGWPRRGVRREDRTIPGSDGKIPVRVYTPGGPAAPGRPLVVAFHGGGWVQGSLEMGDWMCSTVAADLGAVVVSVDYRLAPAHPFPAAVEDCFAALTWSAANGAALGAGGRTGVMGESAGGNLAAVMCLLARERGGPAISHQALIYPATDLTRETESRRRHAHQILLNAAEMEAYQRFYVPEGTPKDDWRLSPLLAPDHTGLPPALVQVAGYDALRDEGIRYAEALRAAGVPVVLTEYPSMPHGFVNFPYLSREAAPALRQIVAEQRRYLLTPPDARLPASPVGLQP